MTVLGEEPTCGLSPAEAKALIGRVIAIGNVKGGVGKSTVAANLTGWLASQSVPVMLIDTDPQGTTCAWMRDLSQINLVHNPLKHLDQAGEWIESARQAQKTFCVVIDLPAVATEALVAAMMLADSVVIPVTPSAADISASEQTLRLVRQCQKARRGLRLQPILVPNRIDRRTILSRALLQWMSSIDALTTPPLVSRTIHAEAIALGNWVGDFAPESAAAEEIHDMAMMIAGSLLNAQKMQIKPTLDILNS